MKKEIEDEKKATWFRDMLDEMKDTPKFKEEMLKLYKEEIHDLQVALQKEKEARVKAEWEGGWAVDPDFYVPKKALHEAEEKYSRMYNVMNEQNSLIATHLNLPGDGRLLSEQVIEAFDKSEARISIWENQYNLLEKQASEWEEKLEKAEERVNKVLQVNNEAAVQRYELAAKVRDLEERIERLKTIIVD